MRAGQPSIAKLRFRVVLALIGALAGFAAVELLARVRFQARLPVFLPDAELGWRPAPELDVDFHGPDFTIRIETDADGLRSGGLGAVDFARELYLLAGDSYTFGWGVSSSETWPAAFDALVHERTGGRARAVNLGVGGYGTTHSARRLAGFLARHPEARPRAMVLLHSHNDMTDDVHFCLVRAGLARYADSARRPSPVRAYEWLRWKWRRRKLERAAPDAKERARYGDVLFAVQYEEIEGEPRWLEAGGARFWSGDLSLADRDQVTTLANEQLTDLQEALLRDAVASVNCAAPDARVAVIHAVIHSAPDWYVEAIGRIVAAAQACGHPVHFAGRIPAQTEFEGPFENAHSGMHFTPALNAFYARKIADFLIERGLL